MKIKKKIFIGALLTPLAFVMVMSGYYFLQKHRQKSDPAYKLQIQKELEMTLFAPSFASNFLARTWQANKEFSLPYRIYIPNDQSTPLPLVLALHSASGRGTNNISSVTKATIATELLKIENKKKYPCILLIPQCPKKTSWSASHVKNAVFNILSSVISKNKVNTNRIYISGQSLGGFGTFFYLNHQPNFFAAAVPIAGSTILKPLSFYNKDPRESSLPAISHIPIWLFHGEEDLVSPAKLSLKTYEKIKTLNSPIKYTQISNAGHISWFLAFDNYPILDWLFSNSK